MKRSTIGIMALTIGLIATAGGVLASRDGMGMNFAMDGMNLAENNTAIKEALKSNDYDAWKSAMLDKFSNTLTEERFNKTLEEYQSREAINQALESGDYAAWKEAVDKSQTRITDVITQDNFAKYVEMQKAMSSRDFATANQLRQELGLGRGMMSTHPGRMHD
jgi:hypothetical protein